MSSARPKVWNQLKRNAPEGAVYVGRGQRSSTGTYGNPFIMGRDGTRSEVIEKYRQRMLVEGKPTADEIEALRGRDLVCWCAPEPCHADLLLELANKRRRGK